ncbi:permease prefix domain 1-containing protein [Clostridium sp. CS001]|uniref:permease prefix domain 1-containing protein n=1 Tax=Clostridium sp. CS001 TaxID=2880648 RepID=UPI001CF15BA9|nr:permease prefix domain 1-containing protein [Clostridium sp. CS001]MCB2290828.1 permease prefix domain 1-containing protein [Clostridium sp. CS001]
MYQFDSYIYSIINDLKISRKQKDEITEEFNDHLEMLKQEYVNSGFVEDEAIKKAIESFGKDKELKKNIANAMLNYRRVPLIVIGVFLSLLSFILCFFTPIGIGMTSSSPNYVDFYTPVSTFNMPVDHIIIINLLITFIATTFLSLPLGYFVPILFSKMRKVRNIIFMSFIPFVLISFYQYKIALNHYELYLITNIIGSVLGVTLGFILLMVLSRILLISSDIMYKKS